MKKLVLTLSFAVLAAFATNASATSPCCDTANRGIPAIDGKSCNDFAPPAVAGCGELDDDNCIGGGPVPGDDPQAQSPLGGCICVGGTCVSDGSVGDALGGAGDLEADAGECTRDAVTACCATGACGD